MFQGGSVPPRCCRFLRSPARTAINVSSCSARSDVGNNNAVDKKRLVKGPCNASSQSREGGIGKINSTFIEMRGSPVLAGCCQEALISRQDPNDSVGTLRQAARSLTLTYVGEPFV